MRSEILLALIKTEVEDSLESLFPPAKRGPRGFQGPQGPRGDKGQVFDVSANLDLIKNLVAESALKFSDLSEEEVEKITGPKGARGKQGPVGKGFIFAEHEDHIDNLIREEVERLKTSLKLTFDDLSTKDKESLTGKRGPRGQRGPKGQDFVFEDHREFFDSLRLRFKDLTEEEVDSLKLKFESLTQEERDSLSLKFSSLTDAEIAKIRGPRGPKGQKGRTGDPGVIGLQGLQGLIGPRGLKGLPGLPGPIGVKGLQGFQGIPGEDAPQIVDIKVEQDDDRFKFEFTFDNGVTLFTEWLNIPQRSNHYVVGGGVSGGSGSGGSGEDAPVVTGIATERVDDTIRFVFTFDDASTLETDYVDLVEGPQGPQGPQGPSGAGASSLITEVVCDSDVYVGAAVYKSKGSVTEAMIDEWPLLSQVILMNYGSYASTASLAKADVWETSNVFGIVVSKESATECTVTTGFYEDLFIGLDVEEEYYLSKTTSGAIVPSISRPDDNGDVRVKIGQAVTSTDFLYQRGERQYVGAIDIKLVLFSVPDGEVVTIKAGRVGIAHTDLLLDGTLALEGDLCLEL